MISKYLYLSSTNCVVLLLLLHEQSEKLHALKALKEQDKTSFHDLLAQHKLEYEHKIKEKDLEIQADLAELESLKHEVDKRVEKERITLQNQVKQVKILRIQNWRSEKNDVLKMTSFYVVK